jgi:hypothetical protein
VSSALGIIAVGCFFLFAAYLSIKGNEGARERSDYYGIYAQAGGRWFFRPLGLVIVAVGLVALISEAL